MTQVAVGADPTVQLSDADLERTFLATEGAGDLVQPLLNGRQIEVARIIGQHPAIFEDGPEQPLAQADCNRAHDLFATPAAPVLDFVVVNPRKTSALAFATRLNIG